MLGERLMRNQTPVDKELAADLVTFLDLIDALDFDAPKWHHLLALGALGGRIRERLGAMDRIPEERQHTNDEQVLDIAWSRLGWNKGFGE